ncbi:transcriptional regulator of RNA polII, SAGA, subunit-domain-containing protein [Epithele typhae]|uniref:transcriptional regulator of RNA polII, SAGA, subunit-domain-containing protein n=1 Tax=Epithele typhae TaxID=378194 RepID=UPI002007E20F|nr:transcriptional regulator of RNA polII, SAGA, subunit-domain-containing protein [Epithele typhae]KAH9935941.1 transcriptional regulator of RNA polII, SAGA, subunit-domain-containing protein [Epithele typhae]
MSLSSTATVKNQITTALGPKASLYFGVLKEYLSGRISRNEYDEQVKTHLDSTHLLQLHNALLVSLFDTSAHLTPPTPPPDVPKPPSRKRKRTLPYQGPDPHYDPATLRSERLKKWSVGLGRRERDRIRALEAMALNEPPQAKSYVDEIAAERGVELLKERGESPGSRLPLNLASMTRGPTLQHISERLNLISAQHNLGTPSKEVASLLMLAFEAKLKQLITQALSLTSTSHAITSIRAAEPHSHSYVLPTSSFDSLFTVSPAVLPNKSAAAMRLALGDNEPSEDDFILKDRETKDPRWQLFALLGERSTVKEALRTLH